MEPVFEKVNIRANSNVFSDEVKAECRTDIFSGSVNKILSVNAYVYPEDESVEEGKIRYGGKVIFRICYVDDEKVLRKCECGNEFFGTILANVPKGSAFNVNIKAEKVNYDLTGSKLIVSALILTNVIVNEYKELQVLSDGKDFICDKKETTVINNFDVKKINYPIEEEIELGYMVKEVLTHGATACITSCQCGVGCVIVDGEVYLTSLLLQNNENSGIIREDKVLPFRIEVEYEESMPQMLATAKVNVKGFKTEISVDEEKGVSLVTATINLGFRAQVFTEEQVFLTADAFSVSEELSLTKLDCEFIKPLAVRTIKERILERLAVNELSADKKVVCAYGEKVEIVSTSLENGQLKVVGIITGKAILQGEEGFETLAIDLPFEKVLDCAIEDNNLYSVSVLPTNFTAKLITAEELEVCFDGVFTIYLEEKTLIKCVNEVNVLGEKPINEKAISVYISTEGESLWSLAKRLNVCPENLLETNNDLEFPLSGKERIVVYRQK